MLKNNKKYISMALQGFIGISLYILIGEILIEVKK